ncbi:DUF4129 domain-containing protein [bacterium]|nr:DUF4129 domain-containing protein [bacterium]
MFGSAVIIGCVLAFGQTSPHHEPIHPADRVFTAEEFRQHLQWVRGQQKILDAVQNMKISPEDQKKMADFAQRLLEQSQKPGPKQDLPIPENLTKDPNMEKLLHDKKFLEWLANNERMQKMAERLASKFNLPKPQQPITPPSNLPGVDPPRGMNNKLNRQMSPPPRRTIPSEQQTGRSSGSSSPSSSRNQNPNGKDQRNSENSNRLHGTDRGTDHSVPIDGNSPTNNGNELGPNSDNGNQEVSQGSDIDPSRHSVLRQMTDAMRKVGPLQNSPTLDRVDDLMGKEPIVPDRIAVPTAVSPSNQWFEQTLNSEWLDSPWVTNLPKSLENIPLPTGWESNAIPLDKIPLPIFPRADWVLPSTGIPPIPGMNLSAGGASLNSGWTVPILLLVIAVCILFFRSLLTGEIGLLGHRQNQGAFGDKPSGPFDPEKRSSVREWFEYLVLSRLGQSARPRTHAQLARSLGKAGTVDQQDSARRLAELYAEARYLPPDEMLDTELIRQAREDLARFAKSTPNAPHQAE